MVWEQGSGAHSADRHCLSKWVPEATAQFLENWADSASHEGRRGQNQEATPLRVTVNTLDPSGQPSPQGLAPAIHWPS